MGLLRYTLVADGPSDQALIPILTWLLRQVVGPKPIQGEFSDLRRLPNPPNRLAERIDRSVELFPCELLFVHRDAERATIEHRVAEIRRAVRKTSVATWPMVCVVPVRMQEAWLLIDENALRGAAGNPNGKEPLDLPRIETLEGLPDPKRTLHELLRQASGLQGRRLRRFNERLSGQRVAELIEDFRPLYRLLAFQRLSADVAGAAKEHEWSSE